MKTTARNQFSGRISHVQAGPATTTVRVLLDSGMHITASLTAAAAEELGVALGQEALALVKSSEVVLVTDFTERSLETEERHRIELLTE